eukprot:jgi/Hompol1/373/HPOL_000231-RA
MGPGLHPELAHTFNGRLSNGQPVQTDDDELYLIGSLGLSSWNISQMFSLDNVLCYAYSESAVGGIGLDGKLIEDRGSSGDTQANRAGWLGTKYDRVRIWRWR